MMRCKQLVVYVTGWAILWTTILPCAVWSTPGKKNLTAEGTTEIPGVDANGNLSNDANLNGEMSYSAALNTKTGRLRVKGKGTTTNLSATRQVYRNEVILFVIALLLLELDVFFSPDDEPFALKGAVYAVTAKGNAKFRGSGEI